MNLLQHIRLNRTVLKKATTREPQFTFWLIQLTAFHDGFQEDLIRQTYLTFTSTVRNPLGVAGTEVLRGSDRIQCPTLMVSEDLLYRRGSRRNIRMPMWLEQAFNYLTYFIFSELHIHINRSKLNDRRRL